MAIAHQISPRHPEKTDWLETMQRFEASWKRLLFVVKQLILLFKYVGVYI